MKMEKLCVFCTNLEFEYEMSSCTTCGYDEEYEMKCQKGHWESSIQYDLTDYREKITKAGSCKDYQQVKA